MPNADRVPGQLEPSLQSLQAQRLRTFRHKVFFRRRTRKHLRQERRSKSHVTRRFWLIAVSTLASLLVVFFAITGAATYASYRFYTDTRSQFLPKIATLRDLLPRDNLKIYDSQGTPIAQLTDQGIHTYVPLKNISQDLINATVATEDKNFWSNPGVDIQRIIQSAIDDLQHGRVVEGGSTITQQLIKKMVLNNSDVNVLRKLQEVMLTPDLNTYYTKSSIMEMYLNSIYYGEQAYGIDAAANLYFALPDQKNKPASSQLDLAQAAMLAGIPNSPYAFDPLQHPQAAFQRLQVVLNLMTLNSYISKAQAAAALQEAQSPHFFKQPATLVNRAPHFVEFVLGQLEKTFHLTRAQLSLSDMSVYTTLDITLQDKIQKIAQQHIAELRDTHHLTNAAEVLIDYHTGAIRSLLGSIDYNDKSIDGQFDVATQGYRQPGSSFKPYVYVTAFDQGASPAQAIIDEPITLAVPNSNPPTFTPTNYDHLYHGHMTLRCALQNSLNIPAVKVLQHVGINNAMKTAQDMGITSYSGTPGYSLVLGGLGVRLLDHTSAIGTFADNGVHVPYYAIDKVVFARTGQVYGHPVTSGKQVISPQLAYMMTSVLSDNASRTPEFFDCNVLQLYANPQQDCWLGNRGTIRPAAAKTGTTNDFRDNWTIGYTTDYVMGVWAGNDDNSAMIDVTGVQGAAPIWHDSMLVAEQNHSIHDFTNPGGLDRATVTYPDGVQSSDWFIPGTVPNFPDNAANAPDNNNNNGDNNNNNNGDNNNGNGQVANAAQAAPFCPSSYNFAFNPPAFNRQAPNNHVTPMPNLTTPSDAGVW